MILSAPTAVIVAHSILFGFKQAFDLLSCVTFRATKTQSNIYEDHNDSRKISSRASSLLPWAVVPDETNIRKEVNGFSVCR